MKRYRTIIAFILLAVYLPASILSSLHVHTYLSHDHPTDDVSHSSEVHEDGCLLCYFQHLVYEDVPPMFVPNIQLGTQREVRVTEDFVFVFVEPIFLSRAPPVLL